MILAKPGSYIIFFKELCMKRVGFFVVMLILIVGMSAFAGGGRGDAGAAEEGQLRVAIAMTPMTNPFHRTMFRFFDEAVEEARITHPHIHFRFYHSSDTEIQVNNMEIILAGNYDGVIVSTFDGNLMAEPVARIRRGGAKVVVVNRMLVGQEWDAFVSGDNVDGGRNVARYMGNFLRQQGIANPLIYVVGMQLGTPIANDRSSGFEEVIRTEFPNIRILGTSEGEHNIVAGFNAMQTILQAHPHIDAVYSHDPFSAMGQEQAIQNAGRNDVRIIMACAPDQSVVAHMRANPNTIFRGNFAYPPTMARDGVHTMLRILSGETPCNHTDPAGGCGCSLPRIDLRPADLLMIENIDQWANTVPSITGR
jgi:ribose transport system substrate-binding protein